MHNSIVQTRYKKSLVPLELMSWLDSKKNDFNLRLINWIIIDIHKQGHIGTTVFNILDNATEFAERTGGATFYKNTFDQTVKNDNFFNVLLSQQRRNSLRYFPHMINKVCTHVVCTVYINCV